MTQPNVCSLGVRRLLLSKPLSDRAEKSLEPLNKIKRSRRKQLKGGIEISIANTNIHKGQVVSQVEGRVALENEIGRQPGKSDFGFLYENLEEPNVCIDLKYIRRSCKPNCSIKHIVSSGEDGKALTFLLVADQNISTHQEITVQFDSDWILSELPLHCANHHMRMKDCHFERERLEAAKNRINLNRKHVEEMISEKGFLERSVENSMEVPMEDPMEVPMEVPMIDPMVDPMDNLMDNVEYDDFVAMELNGATSEQRQEKPLPIRRLDNIKLEEESFSYIHQNYVNPKKEKENSIQRENDEHGMMTRSNYVRSDFPESAPRQEEIVKYRKEFRSVKLEEAGWDSTPPCVPEQAPEPSREPSPVNDPEPSPGPAPVNNPEPALPTSPEMTPESTPIRRSVQPEPFPTFSEFTEQQSMLMFIRAKSMEIEHPQVMREIWREYKRETGSNTPIDRLHYRFKKTIGSKIHGMNSLDTSTKVRILFMTSLPVNRKFLKKLGKDAIIKLDKNDRIEFYDNKENGLKLEGDHTQAVKMKLLEARKRQASAEKGENKTKKRKKVSAQAIDDDDIIFEGEIPGSGPSFQLVKRETRVYDIPVQPTIQQEKNISLEFSSQYGHSTPMHSTPIHSNTPTFYTPTSSNQITSTSDYKTTRSLKDCLRLLKCLAASLDHEMLTESLEKIKKVNEKLGSSDEEIPIEMIQWILNVSITMVTKKYKIYSEESSSEPQPSESAQEATTSLKEFLKLLKIMILGLESPELYELLELVNINIQDLGFNDEKIPMNKVRIVIEMIISTICQ